MVDIHCHVLPNVDDGPKNYLQFEEMAKTAVNAGITDIFATPHHLNGHYENSKSKILERVAEVSEYLQMRKIPLNILPGQELRIHRELFISLEMDEILTLNNMGKYLLLELPSCEIPTYTHEIIYELMLKGITPIIVHPERNKEIIENNNLLFELVQEGALVQLTAGGIIGQFGKKIKGIAEKMIENNLAHFIATDAHNIASRGFFLHEAFDFISKRYGISFSNYFKVNAELILHGKHIQIELPTPIKKKILGIF